MHQCNTAKYTLNQIIGQGEYGTVFKAIKNGCTETIAIKFISLESDQPDLLKLASREIKIMQKLMTFKENTFTANLKDVFFPNGTDLENE